eukprot:TRINITY_DN1264_c1_g3_i1.p1 TRINITY_DN1264_c1_g3~~TRINITY_DN1264_c1_g3_i1.p1  ORF type:complete len:355 (-),score=85.87 TRINITY_DN1264_c1_g3_i1:87-1151(-)
MSSRDVDAVVPLPKRRRLEESALLRGLAAQDPCGAEQAALEALRAQREEQSAREELRIASLRLRLTKLCRSWDQVLRSQSDMDLGVRSTCSSRGTVHVDGQFDWAGWSARDESRLFAEKDPGKRSEMMLQREVVLALAGDLAMRLPWLSSSACSSFDPGALSAGSDSCSSSNGATEPRWRSSSFAARFAEDDASAARERKRLFHAAICDYYNDERSVQVLALDVIEQGRALAVCMHLRARQEAFRTALPRMLDDALGEENGFLARCASGLRPAAAVAFRGLLQRSRRGAEAECGREGPGADLCELLCSFLPAPTGAVAALRDLALERQQRARVLKAQAAEALEALSAACASRDR